MIDHVSVLFLNGYTYIRKHPQLLLTVLLICVIPVAFLLSGQQFLSAGKDNQERLEKDRIGILHDVFASFIVASNASTELMQAEISKLASNNPDIVAFNIGKEEDSGVRILASLTPENIDVLTPEGDAFRMSNVYPNESIILGTAEDGIRYWHGSRLVQIANDKYYIYTVTSLAHIDTLFANRVTVAYYWLFAILGVVLLLILRHVRLIDYAYLYSETKKANEMKDLFTNMVAHELRAPLTAIRGYASLIRESKSGTEEIKKDASRIEDSTGRLMLIVNDLLDVARIHSGKLSVQSSRFNLSTVITSVVDTMQAPAKEKNITLSLEGTVHDVFISTDEKRLFQAFTNLVSNSIKYTKAGNIAISLEERSDRVEVRVKDTGMGISAENQKQLFAPFFRIENTETSGTVGTGLGMWITKQLIELMKGSIAVESIRGVGTHIVVTLPKN